MSGHVIPGKNGLCEGICEDLQVGFRGNYGVQHLIQFKFSVREFVIWLQEPGDGIVIPEWNVLLDGDGIHGFLSDQNLNLLC